MLIKAIIITKILTLYTNVTFFNDYTTYSFIFVFFATLKL